ncbi:MAG TPA: hypothetical protein VIJ60_06895, partial [Acidimicrobiales bacterium]
LIYYAAAGFFTIYYSVTFLNTNGTNFTTSQVNGLNTWFWGANIIALIVVGIVSDLLKVRKPLMLVGAVGSIVTLIVFLSYSTHPHTTQTTLALTSAVLAVFLSLTYAPWMASYTETVEAKNPALVGTGLALWGWILRLTVGISFIFLPIVINSVSPVVNNEPYAAAICYPQPTATTCVTSTKAAKQHITGESIADFVATQPKSVAFAQAHAALLTKIQPYTATLAAAAKGTLAAVARASKALGPATLAQVLRYEKTLTTLVQPFTAQLNYLSAHQAQLMALQDGAKKAPVQWQRWFWIDLGGMVIFIPTIWLTRGRWSPRRARQDEQAHEQAVAAELDRLLRSEGAGAAS